MFEYAAGLFFQQKLGRTLEVAKPILRHAQSNGYPRPFQLSEFRIRAGVREAGLIDRFFFSTNPRVKALHTVVGRVLGAQLLDEPAAYWFHPEVEDHPSRRVAFLTGYWQAAGYVRAVEPTLREEFVLRAPPQARNLQHAELIQGLKCPVSLHLRIGDYALISHQTGAGAERVSNVLKPSYYEKAIAAVGELFPEHTLVVFSDEMARARELLTGKRRCLFVEGNDALNAHEDLRLMSLCKHHIIANSSFSWWGAWLNPDPGKRVFAPRYWGNILSSYFPDLYPDGWTIVDNS
jgi:hypothetical protein